ncbi:hypothetical protein [Streptosporangium roseum]
MKGSVREPYGEARAVRSTAPLTGSGRECPGKIQGRARQSVIGR